MSLPAQSLIRFWLLSPLLFLVVLLGPGCQNTGPTDKINPPDRFVFPNEVTETNSPPHGIVIRVGEKITVIFSDLPPPGIQPHEQRVREDGTITLPLNVTIQAAGNTPRQLEEDIHKKYVPRYYKRMTVTVQAEERYFFVGGEVKAPGRQRYLDSMTVLRAVQSSGDFTDFANRKKIELIRVQGKKYTINWYKAIQDNTLDLEVYPGDTIHVRRRWF